MRAPIILLFLMQPMSALADGVQIAPGNNVTLGIVSQASSGDSAASFVACTGPCNLYGLSVKIGATSGYVILLDTVSDPGNVSVTYGVGQIGRKCYPVTSNGTNGLVSAWWGGGPPMRLNTGLVIDFSTTGCGSITESSSALITVEVK